MILPCTRGLPCTFACIDFSPHHLLCLPRRSARRQRLFRLSLELGLPCIGCPWQMLWSRRRSSRSDPNTHRTHLEPQLSPPRRLSLSTTLISRPPLAPLDPLDPQASQSSVTAAAEDMSSSNHSSSSDNDSFVLKHPNGRQNHPEALDRKSSRYAPIMFCHCSPPVLTLFTSDHPLSHNHHVVHNQIKLVKVLFPHLTHLLQTVLPLLLRRGRVIRTTRSSIYTTLSNRFLLVLLSLRRRLVPSILFHRSSQMPTMRVMTSRSHRISHLARLL